MVNQSNKLNYGYKQIPHVGVQDNTTVYVASAASVITYMYLLYGFLGIYRDTEDVQKRVDILHSSKFDQLNPKQKEAIVRNPVAGQVHVH